MAISKNLLCIPLFMLIVCSYPYSDSSEPIKTTLLLGEYVYIYTTSGCYIYLSPSLKLLNLKIDSNSIRFITQLEKDSILLDTTLPNDPLLIKKELESRLRDYKLIFQKESAIDSEFENKEVLINGNFSYSRYSYFKSSNNHEEVVYEKNIGLIRWVSVSPGMGACYTFNSNLRIVEYKDPEGFIYNYDLFPKF